jgi:protein gp37
MARRLAAMGTEGYPGVVTGGKWNGKTAFVPSALRKAYGWMKPRTIFVGSMSDLFHESVPFEWIDQIMCLVWVKSGHTFTFLTKRAARMNEYFAGLAEPGTHTATAQRLLANSNYASDHHGWHMRYLRGGNLPNLVLGVSAENQQTANDRIPDLLLTRAARRFVSLEPMIGPISFRDIPSPVDGQSFDVLAPHGSSEFSAIHSVILGGESGTLKARYLNSTWVRTIRDQCKAAGVPFMFKQGSGDNTGRTSSHWQDHREGFPVLDHNIHTALAWPLRNSNKKQEVGI